MKKLWHDIQTHRPAALLFLAGWLVSAVIAITVFPDSPVMIVILLAPLLAAGVLGGWWRSRERIGGGVLAGFLTGVSMTLGIVAVVVVGWIQRGRIENEDGGETIGFLIPFVVVGAVLGWVGGRLAIILDRYRRPAANPSSINIKNRRFALIASVVVGIAAGCGKGKETPVGTNAAPTADPRPTDARPAGHWEADITGDGPQRMRVTLDLAKNEKSEWIASMGLPADNKTSLVVRDLVVNGQSVKFVALELMSTPFDLTLGADGNMKGTISRPGSPPVEFKRTGEAKVELIPASPAVSKELEGDWEGSLPMPNGAFRLVFHFKNQPDQTVLITFDTPTAPGLPLNDVKQTGQQVEFGMRIAHGSFQGTLNKAGTELAGQFTHEENSVPLTLRKQSGLPPK